MQLKNDVEFLLCEEVTSQCEWSSLTLYTKTVPLVALAGRAKKQPSKLGENAQIPFGFGTVSIVSSIATVFASYMYVLSCRTTTSLVLFKRTATTEVRKFNSRRAVPFVVLNKTRRRGDKDGCSPAPTMARRLVLKSISTMLKAPTARSYKSFPVLESKILKPSLVPMTKQLLS